MTEIEALKYTNLACRMERQHLVETFESFSEADNKIETKVRLGNEEKTPVENNKNSDLANLIPNYQNFKHLFKNSRIYTDPSSPFRLDISSESDTSISNNLSKSKTLYSLEDKWLTSRQRNFKYSIGSGQITAFDRINEESSQGKDLVDSLKDTIKNLEQYQKDTSERLATLESNTIPYSFNSGPLGAYHRIIDSDNLKKNLEKPVLKKVRPRTEGSTSSVKTIRSSQEDDTLLSQKKVKKRASGRKSPPVGISARELERRKVSTTQSSDNAIIVSSNKTSILSDAHSSSLMQTDEKITDEINMQKDNIKPIRYSQQIETFPLPLPQGIENDNQYPIVRRLTEEEKLLELQKLEQMSPISSASISPFNLPVDGKLKLMNEREKQEIQARKDHSDALQNYKELLKNENKTEPKMTTREGFPINFISSGNFMPHRQNRIRNHQQQTGIITNGGNSGMVSSSGYQSNSGYHSNNNEDENKNQTEASKVANKNNNTATTIVNNVQIIQNSNKNFRPNSPVALLPKGETAVIHNTSPENINRPKPYKPVGVVRPISPKNFSGMGQNHQNINQFSPSRPSANVNNINRLHAYRTFEQNSIGSQNSTGSSFTNFKELKLNQQDESPEIISKRHELRNIVEEQRKRNNPFVSNNSQIVLELINIALDSFAKYQSFDHIHRNKHADFWTFAKPSRTRPSNSNQIIQSQASNFQSYNSGSSKSSRGSIGELSTGSDDHNNQPNSNSIHSFHKNVPSQNANNAAAANNTNIANRRYQQELDSIHINSDKVFRGCLLKALEETLDEDVSRGHRLDIYFGEKRYEARRLLILKMRKKIDFLNEIPESVNQASQNEKEEGNCDNIKDKIDLRLGFCMF